MPEITVRPNLQSEQPEVVLRVDGQDVILPAGEAVRVIWEVQAALAVLAERLVARDEGTGSEDQGGASRDARADNAPDDR